MQREKRDAYNRKLNVAFYFCKKGSWIFNKILVHMLTLFFKAQCHCYTLLNKHDHLNYVFFE